MKKQNYILKIDRYRLLFRDTPHNHTLTTEYPPLHTIYPPTTPHTTNKGLLWNRGNY